MTANVHSPVDRSCNNWLCCLWCCPKDEPRVIQITPAARPNSPMPDRPFQLVRSAALHKLKDVEVVSPGDLDIEFDAVHLKVHHTPQVTPEKSLNEET